MALSSHSVLKDFMSNYDYYSKQNKYSGLENQIIYQTNFLQLKYISSQPTSQVSFFVIPSIINDHKILDLKQGFSVIEQLKNFGDVYFVNWVESNQGRQDANLQHYLHELIAAFHQYTSHKTKSQTIILGHCFGGTLGVPLGVFFRDKIDAMILLTTPWEFGYYRNCKYLLQHIMVDPKFQQEKFIPQFYIRLLFSMMNPVEQFSKYFSYNFSKVGDQDIFFAVENWLGSGADLPRELFFDIIDNLIIREDKYQWIYQDQILDAKDFNSPVLLASGLRDEIVPFEASQPLVGSFKNASVVKFDSGHLGFLIGSKRKMLYNEINNFLTKKVL